MSAAWDLESMTPTRAGRPSVVAVSVGARIGRSTILDVLGSRVSVRCDCGREFIAHVSRLVQRARATPLARCCRTCPLPRTKTGRRLVHQRVGWANVSRCGAKAAHNLTDDACSVTCKRCPSADPDQSIARALLEQVRHTARKRSREMSLTVDDIIAIRLRKPCHYCASGLPATTACLDRVDSACGYTRENVVPCCSMCNDARGHLLTHDEFMAAIAVRLQSRPDVPAWGGFRWRSALRAG